MGSPFTTDKYRDRKPTATRPAIIVAAIGAAVLVLIVALVVAVTHRGGSSGSAVAGEPVGTPGTATGGSPASLDPSTPRLGTAPPAAVSFGDVGGLTLPFSPVDGPTRIAESLATGYSHTPQGAALAAAQIGPRLTYGPGYEAVARAQTTLSSDVQAELIATRAGRVQLTPQDVRTIAQRSAAFQVVSYSPEGAQIRLLYPHPSTNDYRASTTTVEWSNDDWKFGDNTDSVSTAVSDVSEFTPWT